MKNQPLIKVKNIFQNTHLYQLSMITNISEIKSTNYKNSWFYAIIIALIFKKLLCIQDI